MNILFVLVTRGINNQFYTHVKAKVFINFLIFTFIKYISGKIIEILL
jgi:hypothetical protein